MFPIGYGWYGTLGKIYPCLVIKLDFILRVTPSPSLVPMSTLDYFLVWWGVICWFCYCCYLVLWVLVCLVFGFVWLIFLAICVGLCVGVLAFLFYGEWWMRSSYQ